MTPSVLLVAYHFPPIGGAGAQRAVQLARRLDEVGFSPIVITGTGRPRPPWAPLDPRLGQDLETGADVRRVPRPEPSAPGSGRARVERWLRRPSAWDRWWTEGVVRAVDDAATEADLVHVTLAPYETAGAVARIAHRLDLPLVIDLEDPWALDEMMIFPTLVHRRLELRRMRRTLALADAVVMNTPEAARRVRARFPELGDRRVAAISNAFDPEDFRAPSPPSDPATFRIVHTGSLHTDFAARHRRRSLWRRVTGGAVSGVDFLTRSHVYLVEALSLAASRRPDLVERVELHLAGTLTDADVEVIERAQVPVKAHGFLSHPEAISLIRSADLLLLPLHDVAPGTRVGVIPQKTYEYVAAGRPILAAVPPGDVRDLLAATPAARVCPPSDARAIADALLREFERWLSGRPAAAAPPEVLARHDARRLVSEMALVYRRVLAGHGPRGAHAEPPAGRLTTEGSA